MPAARRKDTKTIFRLVVGNLVGDFDKELNATRSSFWRIQRPHLTI
jgi:hypothetical protein